MTAKEYLRGIQRLDKNIDRKIERLHELKEMSTSTGSFDYSKDRVQTSCSGDAPYVRMIEQITDLNNEINTDIDRLVDMKDRVEHIMLILDMSPNQKAVIRGRYFHGYTWDMIAVEVGCTVRNVHYIHQNALQALNTRCCVSKE